MRAHIMASDLRCNIQIYLRTINQYILPAPMTFYKTVLHKWPVFGRWHITCRRRIEAYCCSKITLYVLNHFLELQLFIDLPLLWWIRIMKVMNNVRGSFNFLVIIDHQHHARGPLSSGPSSCVGRLLISRHFARCWIQWRLQISLEFFTLLQPTSNAIWHTYVYNFVHQLAIVIFRMQG